MDRWGERFTRRLFTDDELRYCLSKSRPEVHLAARFAAKEAFLKALGTGLSRGISFTDVEILPAAAAPPEITLHNRARVISVAGDLTGFHLSMSHTGDYAVACVVAVGSK
jgi:holo-[acyl-carrier protein] synthase